LFFESGNKNAMMPFPIMQLSISGITIYKAENECIECCFVDFNVVLVVYADRIILDETGKNR
jgi:hypothetical protein